MAAPPVSLEGSDIIALYDRHARELVGFFARRTGDPQLALDLLGDTFLAAFAARERCDADAAQQRAAWLYRIAGNKLTDHFRRGASERRALLRVGEGLRALSDAEYERIEQLAAADELHDRVNAALDELSDEQDRAIRSRVLGERSYAEVAQDLGVSEQAARARVSRGLRTLRRVLAPSGKGTS
jgi:RNA polymerase sigma factor (sigma-70 family)